MKQESYDQVVTVPMHALAQDRMPSVITLVWLWHRLSAKDRRLVLRFMKFLAHSCRP